MKPKKPVLRKIFRKYLCNRDFLEKHNAENLQDFAQTQLDFELFLDNCYENVNTDDGNPDLGLHHVNPLAYWPVSQFDTSFFVYLSGAKEVKNSRRIGRFEYFIIAFPRDSYYKAGHFTSVYLKPSP